MKQKKKILVVEDQKIDRKVLNIILKDTYDIIEADDGEMGYQYLLEYGGLLSAVLLDIYMPKMDGYEFLMKMQESEFHNLPVIMMTSERTIESEERGLYLGAWDFVSKPFQSKILITRLENAIARSQISLLNQIKHQAEHDVLTDLYNRAQFMKETSRMLNEYKNETFAMVRIDIDRFRLLNTLWGEKAGDRFLKHLADCISTFAGQYDHVTYGRIDADIFTVCLPYDQIEFEMNFLELIDNLVTYNTDFNIKPSAGVYVIEDNQLSIETIYMRASMASKMCKGNYMETLYYYDAEMERRLLLEQEIVDRMETALNHNEFVIYIQPKYHLQSDTAYGGEALVRWLDPERGMIQPSEFIPIMERNGFIAKLDCYVWKKVCESLAKWKQSGYIQMPISVNMSRVEMYNPNIVNILTEMVEQYDIDPALLQLELTESAYMDNPEVINNVLDSLHEAGFTIMMDDFGSGFSSLNTLKDINVDLLKVDMNFLENQSGNGKGEIILASVVKMGRWLNLPVIVEGVETTKQRDFLKSIGCDYAQGFLYSRPMPIEEYEALIRETDFIKTHVSYHQQEISSAIWKFDSSFDYLFNVLPFPVGIYECDKDSVKLVRCNGLYSKEFGYKRSDEKNLQMELRLSDKDYQKIESAIVRVCQMQTIEQCEFKRYTDDGSQLCYRMYIRYWGENGTLPILFIAYLPIEGTLLLETKEFTNGSFTGSGYAESEVFHPESLRRYIDYISTVFDMVRLIDPIDKSVVELMENGHIIKNNELCYSQIQRGTICEKCPAEVCLTEHKAYAITQEEEGIQSVVFVKPITVCILDKNIHLIIEMIHELRS